MTNTGAPPLRRVGALLCRSYYLLIIAAAVVSATAAARTAAAQTKNCGTAVGLWPDGAPQCLNDSTTSGDPAAACCCRETPPGVAPEVWTGSCTLRKGGLKVTTTGMRLDHADGRRELVVGAAKVEADLAWQAGSVVESFKLEILGGAELTTEGEASAELASDGSRVALRADAGRAVLTHRLTTVALVVEPGKVVNLDPAEPETWGNQVEGEVGSEEPPSMGCSAQPRPNGGLPQFALLLLLAAGLRVRRRKRQGAANT